jgi:osmotically-inducible protein OsmY
MQRPSALLATGAALVAAYLVVACSTQPRRTEAERAADASLAAKVEAAPLADPNVYARHIDVAVDRGVAHLGGFVWSVDEYRWARNDAASIPGVKSVVPEMELMRGGVSGTSR